MDKINKNFHVEYHEDCARKKLAQHHHTTNEVIFVKEGGAEFLIEDKHYTISKNCLMLISNFEKHEHTSIVYPYKRYFFLAGNDIFDSGLFDSRLLSIFRNHPKNYCHIIPLNDEQALVIERFFKELIIEYENTEAYQNEMIKLKIFEMLIYLFRIHPSSFFDFSKDSYAKTVIEVQQYLNNHFKENITLKDASALFYTDMYYLSTKFKEIIGYSFKKYLTNLRISHAKYLLLTTDNTISSVCADCGFNDLANFIRTFTSFEKISPTKYRSKFKEITTA